MNNGLVIRFQRSLSAVLTARQLPGGASVRVLRVAQGRNPYLTQTFTLPNDPYSVRRRPGVTGACLGTVAARHNVSVSAGCLLFLLFLGR